MYVTALNITLAITRKTNLLAIDNAYYFDIAQKAIGDQVIVSYLNGPVAGINFRFPVATSIIRAAVFLSFGDIVALAGDFYANWQTIGAQCQPQISDNYDTNPAASIAIFQKVADGLAGDSSSVLPCILQTMQAQALAVQTAIASGQDPAQVSCCY